MTHKTLFSLFFYFRMGCDRPVVLSLVRDLETQLGLAKLLEMF